MIEYHDVPECQRCGEMHYELPFKLLDGYVYYQGNKIHRWLGRCPATHEPIMMREIIGRDDRKKPEKYGWMKNRIRPFKG